MAITDNLAILIKAELGQTVITDSIAGLVVDTGTGTVTQMEDATYGRFWRLTGGAKSAVLSGMGEWMNANSTTMAMRFRVSNRADNYTRFVIVGSTADSGLMIGNAGTSTGTLRVGVQVGGSTIGSAAPASYTTGDILTAVLRYVEGTTDSYDAWYTTSGRVGTDPNVSSTGTYATATRNRVLLQFLAASENLDIFDYAMLTRGVTNAEGAALADDIRGTLYAAATNDPPTFPGPNIGNQTGTVGTALTSNTISDSFSDVDALTFTAIGSWPPGVTVSSVGVISGTPTTAGTYATLSVRATDTAAQTIDSDTFSFTIDEAVVNAAPTFTGPNIGNQTGTVGVALTLNTVSDSFTDTDALTFTAIGAWPAGVTVSSAGVISGTPTTSGTYASLKVRATDTIAQTVDSDTFSFTIAEAPVATGTITVQLKNNTGTPLINETGVVVNVYNASTGALIVQKTGLTSDTSGNVVVNDVLIVTGTSYAFEHVLSGSRRRLPVAVAT